MKLNQLLSSAFLFPLRTFPEEHQTKKVKSSLRMNRTELHAQWKEEKEILIADIIM